MINEKPIQVFEYEFLAINDARGFKESHWKALGDYNEAHGGNFFKLTNNGVRFQNYVGVIQTGDITIEILPKIGKESDNVGNNKASWQQVLIEMLRECNWMKVHAHEKASLQFKHNNILDAYLELYIRECEKLLHLGLIKKYRLEERNVFALKGKLLFSENIQKNVVHQERFYTRHQVYDRNNIFNQILLKALKIIPTISNSPLLKDRVYGLLFSFPELDEINVNEATFSKLAYDRKSFVYQEAIEIAAMLLLNYRPDVSAGQNHVLAILFDMNDLWEEYVYRQIVNSNNQGWKIVPQEYQTVWQKGNSTTSKGVKPDIVISNKAKKLIIDTKWKLPEDDIPADGDLKQMFMYNEYWEGANAVLLYPKARNTNDDNPIKYTTGQFIWGLRIPTPQTTHRHDCGVLKACILDKDDKLDFQFGEYLNKKINEIINR
jgi:5-methylcytosine-specific restriction enzyme subunit McrC